MKNNIVMLEKLEAGIKLERPTWKEMYVKLDSFGGFLFVNSKLYEYISLIPKPIIDKYASICSCYHIGNKYFKQFKDKLNPDDYFIYKFREYELYINKNNLRTIEYVNGGYEFEFMSNDGWFIKCEKSEIVI